LAVPFAGERQVNRHQRDEGDAMSRTEASRRNWPAIGVGSVAAAAVVALYVAGIWALTVLVEFLA
jgi:hypothetical protein